jgi:hypothetical protein
MKLTKIDREAFVKAVMQDVPRIDYQEQIRALVQNDAISQLPEPVRKIAKTKHLTEFLEAHYFYLNGSRCVGGISVRGPQGSYKPSEETQQEAIRLHDLYEAQRDKRNQLEQQLEAAIGACTTLKVAKERLPEFEKYLPQDRDGTGNINLPTTTHLVDALSAAGWQKAVTAEV